ncbi:MULTISPECIES: hypothetical protein [unclassified Paludibacterium]|uniref:winged helix-turn-helix domain-containing protein n=1 Tax=unclassified Paludibacterium TaxID=2618429 RepID=UPI001C055AC8|nr:hypothetical protein [Paludibacterium sp. B53371]BEV71090.1 hypothetical protein THUN1379_05720 [Paludibacterium sp. THUN1379]
MYFLIEDGQVIFDAREDCLIFADGRQHRLSHPEGLLLRCLLTAQHDKRQIIETVWPGSVVTDSSYHKLIHDLRKQFSQQGLAPENIKTIPRRGCRYLGTQAEYPTLPAALAARRGQSPAQALPPESARQEALAPAPPRPAPPSAVRRAQRWQQGRVARGLSVFLLAALLGYAASATLDERLAIGRMGDAPRVQLGARSPSLPASAPAGQFLYFSASKSSESYLACKQSDSQALPQDCHGTVWLSPGH